MTSGIRARLRSGHSKGSMLGSNVDETNEQTRGRETEPTARGWDRKDKSLDAIANMEARLVKVELAMGDTREEVDLIEQGMEKGLEDLREQIQDLREGVLGSQVQLVSHEEFISFQDKVMSMFASVESTSPVTKKESFIFQGDTYTPFSQGGFVLTGMELNSFIGNTEKIVQ